LSLSQEGNLSLLVGLLHVRGNGRDLLGLSCDSKSVSHFSVADRVHRVNDTLGEGANNCSHRRVGGVESRSHVFGLDGGDRVDQLGSSLRLGDESSQHILVLHRADLVNSERRLNVALGPLLEVLVEAGLERSSERQCRLVGFNGRVLVRLGLLGLDRVRKDHFLGLHHHLRKSIVNTPSDRCAHVFSHLRLVLAVRVGSLLFGYGVGSVECLEEDLLALIISAVLNFCADEFGGFLSAAFDFVCVRS